MAEQTKKETRPTKPSDGGDAGRPTRGRQKARRSRIDVDSSSTRSTTSSRRTPKEFVKSYVQRGK